MSAEMEWMVALNIEKQLKSRIWHCLYSAVQRKDVSTGAHENSGN